MAEFCMCHRLGVTGPCGHEREPHIIPRAEVRRRNYPERYGTVPIEDREPDAFDR
jgi:hypothetical protein